jgi:tRNA (cytidine56-2'-O)-methyltransferase
LTVYIPVSVMLKVLRIGHRPARDKRITTHVALVARALGADGIIISTKDPEIEKTVRSVVSRFGGDFQIESGIPWKQVLNSWQGLKVHLTMYGMPLDETIQHVRGKDVLVVVGAEKVPSELYTLADYNIAVGNQPHSEVAALALFLDRYHEGRELSRTFPGARLRIIPSERGKTVVDEGRNSG